MPSGVTPDLLPYLEAGSAANTSMTTAPNTASSTKHGLQMFTAPASKIDVCRTLELCIRQRPQRKPGDCFIDAQKQPAKFSKGALVDRKSAMETARVEEKTGDLGSLPLASRLTACLHMD